MEEPQIGLLLVEELNNSVILQWGICDLTNTTYTDITFPTSYTSTNYKILFTDRFAEESTSLTFDCTFSQNYFENSVSTTRCIASHNDVRAVNWFGIGF